MKATTDTPNTLFLAVWHQKGQSVALGNFRTMEGMEPEIEGMGPLVQAKGNDPFVLLAKVLSDVKCLCARHIVVFTNDAALAETFTFPVRLEPTSPDRTHLSVPAQWDIIRELCLYETWQMKHAEKLPKAAQYWEETYGKHTN